MIIESLLLALFVAFWFGIGCGSDTPPRRSVPVVVEEWDHGFKNDYVIATRYSSPHGFNIGFRFPKHAYNCDSPELFDWFHQYDGYVFQGGGYAGAEVFVIFKGVTDKETANKKLAVVMPALTAFMKTVKETAHDA